MPPLMPGDTGYVDPEDPSYEAPDPRVPDINGDWSGLAFFESTGVATDADSGTGFAAEGNIGDVSLISSIYSGMLMLVDDNGDPVEDDGNADENILLLMPETMTGVVIAAEDGDFGGSGGIDAGIARVGTGGASIGDVEVITRLEQSGPGTTASDGLVIAAGVRPREAGVYATGETDAINPVRNRFGCSSIGAIDFTDTDEMPNSKTPSGLQVVSELGYRGATASAIPVIIDDVIESVTLSNSLGSVLGSGEPDFRQIVTLNTDEEDGYAAQDLVIITV